MEKITAPNYTDEQTADMVERYNTAPTRETVDAIAQDFGKSTRSVIAKLSREGVYKAQPRTTKTGAPVIRKSDLVAMIEESLDTEVPTLEKASKQDLERLVAMIEKVTTS